LIFDAAFHLYFSDVRKNLGPVILFAIPGVIITTFLVGRVVAWGSGVSFAMAAVFGALVAATDLVAVVVMFRAMGVPKQLRVLLEGEMFNDGTVIIVFGIALEAANGQRFQLTNGIVDFVVVAGGGLLVGVAVGGANLMIVRRLDDYLI
jgi:CPA1 family monovalent cation:H+ antiporter